ncbi:C2 family cysteine protease [Rariglobus hedericola]|uniref:Peptidase C2 n=1 Tax=Rariglobus hedericola TaxID=2597822 RepID=A0A556QEK5_9BACT|nr:C2 family cysteine protease [Rariglobus hedericola]TSJ75084.1 peptidase C2 [Rariglobus hedericola]
MKPHFLILLLLLTISGSVFAKTAPTFVESALAGFDAWDADHDGALTTAELDTAVASPSVKGEAAAAAAALARAARNKKQPIDAFTRDNIPRLASTLKITDSRDAEESPDPVRSTTSNLERYYDSALGKINARPRALFVGEPRLDRFRQGRLGTCFCLAPLTALAYSDPSAIPALFKSSPDGSRITVTFGQDNPVEIVALTDGEIALGTDTGGNGLWAATYEKAVGKLRLDSKPVASPATPYANATRGGSAGTMLSVLTGRSIRRFSCKPWLESATTPPVEAERKLGELRELLRSASREKRLMTAGTSSKTVKVPSLAANHAYAVLGYDEATDLVTVRDPHGQNFSPKGTPGLVNGYAVNEGIFRIPVPEIVRLMSGFAFALNTPEHIKGYPSADPAIAVPTS